MVARTRIRTKNGHVRLTENRSLPVPPALLDAWGNVKVLCSFVVEVSVELDLGCALRSLDRQTGGRIWYRFFRLSKQ